MSRPESKAATAESKKDKDAKSTDSASPEDEEQGEGEGIIFDENDEIIELPEDGEEPPEEGEGDEAEREAGLKQLEDFKNQLIEEMAQVDIQDDSHLVFEGHAQDEPVYCVALSPQLPGLALTGGGDDRAYLWSTEDGKIKHCLKDHKETVCDVAFSPDAKLIATAALDGNIHVYDTESGKLLRSLEGPAEDVEWIEWYSKGHVLAAGSRDTSVWLWNAEDGKVMQVFSSHTAPVTVGTFCENKLVTGAENGVLHIWNVKEGKSQFKLEGQMFHDGPVTSLVAHPSEPLILTGGDDGLVFLVNPATGKVVNRYKGHDTPVESVSFCKSLPLIASGAADGKINIWNRSDNLLRASVKHDEGVVHLQFHDTDPLLYSCSQDGTVRLWDARDGKELRVWRGHRDVVLGFAISKDGKEVVSCSDDGTARVFRL